jgi:hypothetical protein
MTHTQHTVNQTKPTTVLFIDGLRHQLTTNATGTLFANDIGIDFCIDTGSSISLMARSTQRKYFPDAVVNDCPVTGIALTGIGKGPELCHYINVQVKLRSNNGSDSLFDAEIYLVNELPCRILLGVNFLKTNDLNISWASKTKPDRLHKSTNLDDTYFAFSTSPSIAKRKAALLYSTSTFVLLPGTGRNVSVRYRDLPPAANGYTIRPRPLGSPALDSYASLVNGIVDGFNVDNVPIANFGNRPVKILANQCLGSLSPCTTSKPPQCETYINLASVFEGLPPIQEQDDEKTGFPYIVTPPPEEDKPFIDKAIISDHWGPEYKTSIMNVLLTHNALFSSKLGKFNDGIEMPIPFKDESDLSGLRQFPYNLSKKDKEAMNSVLDPLRKAGVIEPVPLGTPSPIASPAFVVYRNDKPRVVVDLRRVNSKGYIDAYPLPRQDTILQALGGRSIFSSVDMVKSFFQQPIKPADRWKTAFVTPHRGHEQMTRASMGFASSPAFFQHRMELLFGKYLWDFVLVYIDDIIIFSKDPQSHIRHLDKVLRILRESGVTLNLSKCVFAQPSLKALGHYINRLGLSTTDDKVEAIKNLKFPTTLRELETGLGLFGYYRHFVPHFSSIARPLLVAKTKALKGSPISGQARRNWANKSPSTSMFGSDDELTACHSAWNTLKDKLCNAPVLAYPDFNQGFILYTDGSKERGFGVALHQKDSEGIERPILFLSRDITPAEHNYWPTELETAALIWALDKLPQYFDHGKFTVYTDHASIKQTFHDLGPAKGKRSARLTSWRLQLSKYADRMEVLHRAGRTHKNADALSRLPVINTEKTVPGDVATCLHVDTPFCSQLVQPAYPVDTSPAGDQRVTYIFNITDQLRDDIVKHLPSDRALGKVYSDILQRAQTSRNTDDGPITTLHSF